ncbi:MAG: VWA containing CoxE family protein [Lachnospiraceae bacterium]|nr:VWA containing CoxE family protein [Lachnospiraceae bacterium]
MFQNFFNALKNRGVNVSLSEWLTLQQALDEGLCESSLTRFYHVARSILVHSEADFDKYDLAFEDCFKSLKMETEVSAQMLRWLDKPDENAMLHEKDKEYLNSVESFEIDKDDVEKQFKQRLKDQDSEHNGGAYWIGTMGKTSFGNTGGNIGGIRVGGATGYQSAFQVIGARRYRDFRDDRVLTGRQFMTALRRLRQFSTKLDIPKTELDINSTVDRTCNNGGCLEIVMDRPRKNSVKLLLLMDSGGTMIPYCQLLNELFQSVHKSNHYREVKTYYFHNCIYSHVYNTPACENGDWTETEWMFRNLDKDFKVIIVGDAAMAPEELYARDGNYRGPNGGYSGQEWLLRLRRKYRRVVWMNPKMSPTPAPWREAETAIKEIFPMLPLTVAGLNAGMEILMQRQ